MAKKPRAQDTLTFVEIVMRAEADVIKAAYEARVKIDGLLAERQAAYQRIFELENEVEAVIGEEGVFAFPPPPVPVAGLEKGVAVPRTPKTAPGRSAPSRAPAGPTKPKGDKIQPPESTEAPASEGERDATKTSAGDNPETDTPSAG